MRHDNIKATRRSRPGVPARVGGGLRRLGKADTGAMTIEQIGWALFWTVTIGAIVGVFGPWLLARVNTIMGQF